MTGIVIIAHAPLASALEQCVEHVYSCEPGMTKANLRALDVTPGASVDALLDGAMKLVAEVNTGAGCSCSPMPSAQHQATWPHASTIRTRHGGGGRQSSDAAARRCYRGGSLAEVADKALAGGQQGMVQIATTSVQNQATSRRQ